MFVTIIFRFDVSCLIECDSTSIGVARGAHICQLIRSCEQMFVTIIFRFDVSCLIECDLTSIGVARGCTYLPVNPVMRTDVCDDYFSCRCIVSDRMRLDKYRRSQVCTYLPVNLVMRTDECDDCFSF